MFAHSAVSGTSHQTAREGLSRSASSSHIEIAVNSMVNTWGRARKWMEQAPIARWIRNSATRAFDPRRIMWRARITMVSARIAAETSSTPFIELQRYNAAYIALASHSQAYQGSPGLVNEKTSCLGTAWWSRT